MYPKHLRKTQEGVVIVIALFIVALIATMSYMMISRVMRDTERATLITHDIQAESDAEGSVLWAIELLRSHWNNKKENQLVDVMPIVAPSITMNGYKIESNIQDLQSRFNINNLQDEALQPDFAKLITLVDKKIEQEEAIQIAKEVTNWILPAHDKNDQYYAELPTPYRAAHQLMQNTSELLLIKGVTPNLYLALKPFIVALPVKTKLNIQTADPTVIASLKPEMTLEAANTLASIRREKPFNSIDDLTKVDIIKNYNLSSDKMTVISQYFLVETRVTIEKQRIVIYTLLERNIVNGKAKVIRLWQSKGIWA